MTALIHNKSVQYFLNYIFFISIIVDNINGFLQIQKGIHLPIGVVYRLSIIVLLLISMRKVLINKIILVSIILIPILLYWMSCNYSDIQNECMHLSDITYLYLFVCYFFYNIDKIKIDKLINYISLYGTLIGIILSVCFILGIGNHSYGEDYGFGTKAFFKAGNDLSLTLIYTLVFTIIYYLNYSSSVINLGRCFIICMGAILVGSRVGMVLSTIIMFFFLFYICFSRKTTFLIKILMIFMLLFIPYLLFYIYSKMDSYALSRLTLESVTNARTGLTIIAINHIESFDGISLLIGEGASSLFRKVANTRGMSLGEERVVEADIYEIIGSYGYFMGIFILFLFFYICWKAFKLWMKYKNTSNFMLFVLSFLFVFIGALAGHAIKNVMIAPIYGIMAALILRNIPLTNKS